MHIDRVQVDGGFLNDLDVRFETGLNVLIGARGTGKTSLIELIRYAIGSKPFTMDAERRGNQHAINVLQGGKVTVTLCDGEERWEVTRGARDELPRSVGPIPSIMVLAQSEIEAVGAQANGRLQLIDRFRPDRAEADVRYDNQVAVLRSLTSEIGGILGEYGSIIDQIDGMKGVREEKNHVLVRQQDMLKSIEATADQRKKVEDLQIYSATLSVRDGIYDRAVKRLRGYREDLLKIEEGVRGIEEWPSSAGETDLLDKVRTKGNEAAAALGQALEMIRSAESEIDILTKRNSADRTSAEERARRFRRELDELEFGAGELTRKVNDLAEREAQLGVLEELAKDRSNKIAELQERRRHVFESLEKERVERFESRSEVVNHLGESLSPKISARIVESGITDEYTNIRNY